MVRPVENPEPWKSAAGVSVHSQDRALIVSFSNKPSVPADAVDSAKSGAGVGCPEELGAEPKPQPWHPPACGAGTAGPPRRVQPARGPVRAHTCTS